MTDDTKLSQELILAVPKQQYTAQQYEERRAERVEFCLWWMLTNHKVQIEPGLWGPLGLLEVEAFLEAHFTGLMNPYEKLFKKRAKARRHKRGQNLELTRTTRNERLAQRILVLGCIAVGDRAKLGKVAARERIAKAAEKAQIFIEGPTADALKHWELRLEPPLTPFDEGMIAYAISRSLDQHGVPDPNRLISYFIKQALAMLHPGVIIAPPQAETTP
jgi:hypothetical protein